MSIIKANKLEHISTSNGGIQLDNAGHVTVDGQQLPTAGTLSNRNLIINGAMQVAQRGTSSTSNGYGTVDRFASENGTGTFAQSQGSLTSGDPYNEGFRNFFRNTNTTAASNTTGHRNIRYEVEAQDIIRSGWIHTSATSYLTISFWVRSSVSQEFYGSFRTFDGTSQNYVFSLGTLSANTWTKITKTIPGNSNITIDDDNGSAIRISFAQWWGVNYTSNGVSTDAWQAFGGGTRFPDFTNTWGTTADATFDITGVQLEVGEKATPFEHRSYGDELAKCQRYCQKFSGGRIGQGIINHDNAGDRAVILQALPVTMRATPTLESVTNGNIVLEGAAWYAVTGTPTLTGEATSSVALYNISTSSQITNATTDGIIPTSWGNGAVVTLSAEL